MKIVIITGSPRKNGTSALRADKFIEGATVIDRFYANNTHLKGSHKYTVLMATAYDTNEWTMSALVSHYQTIVKYLEGNDAGMLLATGVWNRGDLERTHYPEQAYDMGRNLQS